MDFPPVQALQDTAWRMTAEAIVCALLPSLHPGWPSAPGPDWRLAGAPRPPVLELRADCVGPGYVICDETAGTDEEWTKPLPRIGTNAAGIAAALPGPRAPESVRQGAGNQGYRVPVAAFRHCGQAGMPVYFGYAAQGGAECFSSQAPVSVRQGIAHPHCPAHAAWPVAYLAEVMRDYVGLLWQACGCAGSGDLLIPAWTLSEPEFLGMLAGRHQPQALAETVVIAQAAGLVRIGHDATGHTRTGLLPAGGIWWAANQRLANQEIIAGANLCVDDTFNFDDDETAASSPGGRGSVAAGWRATDIVQPGLVPELAMLREHLQQGWRDPYVAAAAGAIAEAEIAAGSGDSVTVRIALGRAGKQALQVAHARGLQVAVAAITTALAAS